MRQSHPELNFRRGKGAIRERRKAFSRDSLAATCDLLGMNATDKETFLVDSARVLAILALQSDRYRDDMDYRDAVDDVLALTAPAPASASPQEDR